MKGYISASISASVLGLMNHCCGASVGGNIYHSHAKGAEVHLLEMYLDFVKGQVGTATGVLSFHRFEGQKGLLDELI